MVWWCRLYLDTEARGNLIPDAYLAALAIESGSGWISSDRDYSRFAGLRWRPPGRGRHWVSELPSPAAGSAAR